MTSTRDTSAQQSNQAHTQASSKWFGILYAQIFNRPKTLIVLVLLCIVGMSIGAKNLYFRGDYKVFFEPDNPQRLAYEEMQRIFTKNESVSILISKKGLGNSPSKPDDTSLVNERSPLNEHSLFNKASLTLIKTLTDESWQIPLSTRVDSITNFQHTYAMDDDLIVEDLLLELDWLDAERIQTIARVSTTEPDLVNKLISPAGDIAMINITVQLPDGDQTKEITEIGAYVRDMIAPYQAQYPEHDIRLSGIVIMTDAMFLAAIKDAFTLFPVMFLVITVLLALLMRSVYATIATLIIVTVCVTATLGLGGWLGMFMNIASANVPVIIMTLAIADSVHLVTGLKVNMSRGMDKVQALKKSIALNTKPIIITSVTTAIGFLTLNFAKVPILSDLGNLVAIGVSLACITSLTLLPALLYIMPVNYQTDNTQLQASSASGGDTSLASNNWEALSNWVGKYYKLLLLACVAITGVSSYLASQNELNDIAIDYFNKGNSFRQDADFQQAHLSGLSTIDFGIYTDSENAISQPEFLQTVEAFTAWLEQQDEVDHVLSFANTMKRLNMNLNADKPAFYQLPDASNTAAQYLLLYEMSLPFGLDINNQIDINKSAVRVMVTLKNLGSKSFTGFEDRAKAWMAERAPEYRMESASLPLIFAHIGKANMQGMITGAVVALLLISALLFIALKDIKLGLVSLLPNLMPALIGFGAWALISGEISMALSVVLTMTLGIIVDDTVHFLSKYKSGSEQGLSAKQSVSFAFENVGNALVITTVVLCAGFAVLALSDFAINSDMGTLTAIIIGSALFVDLLLLPALLVLVKGRDHADEPGEHGEQEAL